MYKFDDHGWYCNECTDSSCSQFLPAICNQSGQVYVNEKQKCVPCQEEFGQGTISCSNWGANECSSDTYKDRKKVNETIQNIHCTPCNQSIANCAECENGDVCLKCAQDFILVDGQCFQDGQICNKKFPYKLDDHGYFCSECSEKECVKYDPKVCAETNHVYNNELMKCSPCSVEFGTGTKNCSVQGATQCEDTHY